MHPSVPDALRFPPPPEGWTHASDEVLAEFVAQVVGWRDRVVQALADGQALAGLMTGRGRGDFAAALRREPPAPDPGSRRTGLSLFPEVSDASRVTFDDIMEWRDCVVNVLVLDQDLAGPSHHRSDAFVMRTCLHPAGPRERCDVCVLEESDGHRCPMSPWCDPPPYVGQVRPFPDRLRFPAPALEGPWASDRSQGAFVEAVLAWRRRVVAALRDRRDTLPDTLTDLAASYLLSALSAELPLVSSWTPRFPSDVPADRQGSQTILKWRDRFVSSLFNARTDDDNTRILSSREERVLRQFMRPPDGDERCSLCLAPYSRVGQQVAHSCPTIHGSAARGTGDAGPRAVAGRSTVVVASTAPDSSISGTPTDAVAGRSTVVVASTASDLSISGTPTAAAVIGGLLLCAAVVVPASASRGLIAALGAVAMAVGVFVCVRRRASNRRPTS